MNDKNIPRQDSVRLAIKVSGPRVGCGRMSASDLAEIVRRVQQGSSFVVDSISVLDDEMSNDLGTSFWQSASLDEMVEQQGVRARDGFDDIDNPWPADDDPDEFMRYLLHDREQRRKLAE